MSLKSNENIIAQEVRTRENRDLLLLELENISFEVFQKKSTSLEDYLSGTLRMSTAKLIRTLAKDEGISLDDKEGIANLLSTLKDKLLNLKVLTLTLAFEPTEKTIDKLYDEVSKRFGPEVILDFLKDRGVAAGAIVSYAGIYTDYSLRKIVREKFESEREKLNKII